MSVNSNRALPPALSEKLASLGRRLERGPGRELREVLDDLSAIPPNQIARASREIAVAARLGWSRPVKGFSLTRFFRRPLSEYDLLKRDADYAWLFLFHPSGYVREAALDAILTPPASPFFFAALAWRLNDWVTPVRRAAKRCAERVLPLASVEVTVSAALYLLDRRFAWGRWTDEPEVLDAIFSSKQVMRALAIELSERATGPLATGLRCALRYPNIDDHLEELAASAVQPTVRAVAYRCLLTGRATWPVGYGWEWVDKVYGLKRRVPKIESRRVLNTPAIPELIRKGIRDKSPKVRIVAADALIEVRARMPDAEELLRKLASDRSAAVRASADYMLRHPTTHIPDPTRPDSAGFAR